MEEEKKSEASCEEPERLRPYVLQEQVEQEHDSQVELYLATHETSGATALVRKHAAEESVAPRKDWRVLLGSWASRGYSAMEVEHTDWARAQDRQSAESLLLTVESVLEEVRRMARAMSDTHEPRPRWRLGLALASAAAVCALLFALVRLTFVPQPPDGLAPITRTEPAHEPVAFTDTQDPPLPGIIGYAMPEGPFKEQKRPPCIPVTETEIRGGCWTQHKLDAPCPRSTAEYQGKCYMPVKKPDPQPRSIQP